MEVTVRVLLARVLLPLCRIGDAVRIMNPVDGFHSPICSVSRNICTDLEPPIETANMDVA